MKRACIVVLDAAQARLFSYQPHDGPEPALREELEFVNEGRRDHGKFSETKPGNRWQEGGRGSTDDHRNAQIADHDEKFVKRALGEVAHQVQELGFPDVILIASPKMLGLVRSIGHPVRKDVAFIEIAQDLSWMTPSQLHDHLAERNLIGARPRVSFQSNPRAR
jgi:protein required for attachment to host cells